jgi:hypothetical protein
MPYPPDPLPTDNENATPSLDVHPGLHDDVNAAVNDVVAELGANPSGTFGTVQDRLGNLAVGADLDDHELDSSAHDVDLHYADTTGVHGIIDTSALETTAGADAKVAAHVADATSAHIASAVTFTPTGSIAATDVQAAITEVALEVVGPNPEVLQVHAATGVSEVFDVGVATVHTATLDSNAALTFAAPPSATAVWAFTLVLAQDATGGRTVTWPGSVKWAGGLPPTLTVGGSKIDVFSFFTSDGGTTWFGFISGQDF